MNEYDTYDTEEVYRLAANRWPDVSLEQTRLILYRNPDRLIPLLRPPRQQDIPLEPGDVEVTFQAERVGPYWMAYSPMRNILVLWLGYDEYDMEKRFYE